MSSSSSAMLTTLGVTFGIPLVNSAAGAVVGASGAALLSIQHDNYDVLLATKVGTAGSAILSLPVVFLAGIGACASCCGSEAGEKSAYAFGMLALLDLVFITISGEAGYAIVDREGSKMSSDQMLASTATGVGAIIGVMALALVGYGMINKLNAVELNCFSKAIKAPVPTTEAKAAPSFSAV